MSDEEIVFSVEQDIPNFSVEAATILGPKGDPGESATIQVGTTETLPTGQDAYVENVGTSLHGVFNFGIPRGPQGETGEPGQDGQDATINGQSAVAIVSGPGIDVTMEGANVVISNTGGSSAWGYITGTLSNQTDLQNALNAKQDTISDLNTIRSGAEAGATALQPSDVVNNVLSTATNKPLSANMGKELQDEIDNLKARGRFLALWNCATGLAQSNPPESPYEYKTGDYFVVGTVASGGASNYKPNGSTYTTGVASSTVETTDVAVDDVYYYDGTNWRLQQNTQKTLTFANIAGDPYDNTNLANALNAKQATIDDLSTIRSGAAAGATAVQPADLTDYAKKNVAQTFTAVQTFNANVDIKNGSALKSESADMVKRDDTNSKVEIGNGSDALSLNGSGTRPKYNNNDLALGTDVTVTDVQVNGTTILNNKIANIPYAGAQSAGVVRVSENGLGINAGNGQIYLDGVATTSELSAKTATRKYVSPSNLDAAVKTGITTNTNTLTASEKQTAANWILPAQSADKILGTDGTNISWDYGVEFIEWSD